MAILTAAGFETQQDTRFADNSNGDIDEADYRDAFEDVADSCAFTADINTFSESNIFGEIDHTQVVGATSISAYDNTGENAPTLHVYSNTANPFAIAIENTNNSDADTKRWVFDQETDGDFVINRISESGGTDTATTAFKLDQNDDITAKGEANFCSGNTGQVFVQIADEDMVNGEIRAFRARGNEATAGNTRNVQFGVAQISGNTNPAGFIRLDSQDGAGNYFWTDDSDILRIGIFGQIGTTGGTVVGTQTSDSYYKSDICDSSYGLDEVLKLSPRHYTMYGKEEEGFLAQEVQLIIPEAVYDTGQPIEGEGRTKLAMDYVRLIPALINAIKELNAKIESK